MRMDTAMRENATIYTHTHTRQRANRQQVGGQLKPIADNETEEAEFNAPKARETIKIKQQITNTETRMRTYALDTETEDKQTQRQGWRTEEEYKREK